MTVTAANCVSGDGYKLAEEQLVQELGQLDILDDLIRHRAEDPTQVPILAYPAHHDNDSYYNYYTGKELDWLISERAEAFMSLGLNSVSRHDTI